ncbi:MAG: putative tricarboxylic transport rane protein [Pseudomonadota bacterium]|nr:putative tricarboxylic transport rane protein [Pseudomonadota bacterium]
MKFITRLALSLTMATVCGAAAAQAWPAKPIRIVVPFPPGGGTDIIARETSQRVAKATGWIFVIDNKSGAGGNLGVDSVAKSAADGYTLVIGQTSNIAINPTLYSKLPYDPQKDLSPVVLLASSPLVLVTAATSPLKTLADVANTAKARPGELNIATSGNGTVAHLTSELFQKAASIKMQHVPYKGAGPAMTDVISGNVDLYISAVPTLIGQIRQGKLRALAVSSAKRVDDLPQVPTINETELAKRLGDEGADPLGGTPEQFAALIKDDIPRWGRVVKESGARVD